MKKTIEEKAVASLRVFPSMIINLQRLKKISGKSQAWIAREAIKEKVEKEIKSEVK